MYVEYEYNPDYQLNKGNMKKSVSKSAIFVNREDAENYCRSRNENTLPC
jgi:hypothetical protein